MDWRQSWGGELQFKFLPDVSAPPDERIVWQDQSSPLRICKIGTGGTANYRLRPGDWMFTDVISGDRLVSRARTGSSKRDHDHFLADQVIPRLIAYSGKLVLHAGAIEFAGRAILFVGPSGHGKSTICASFAKGGYRLLGDDAIVITDPATSPRAKTLYPSLRLLPDSFAALLPEGMEREPLADYSEKQRAYVSNVYSGSLPLGAIFILASEPDAITIRQAGAAEAAMAIVENTFALDPSDLEGAAQRLQIASGLIAHVPAFVLGYPRNYDRLPEVEATILASLEKACPISSTAA